MSASDSTRAAGTSCTTLIPVSPSERAAVLARFKRHPDFPRSGIMFVDIFPLFTSPSDVRSMMASMEALVRSASIGGEVVAVVGLEARGFLLGALLADKLGCGFLPVRKAGKLPGQCVQLSYSLEYGSNTFEMQKDHGYAKGSRVVLIDDLLATGGSLAAAGKLVQLVGLEVAAAVVVIELEFLHGAAALPFPVFTYAREE